MDKEPIRSLLTEIENVGVYHHRHPVTGVPLPMRCLVLPWLDWDPEYLENSLAIALPPDLRALWDQTSGIVMFQDMTYGQWGLVLWSPDQALVRHQRYVADRFNEPGDLRPGDFITGEILLANSYRRCTDAGNWTA